MQIKKTSSLKGEIKVPGDKSISHRAIMFGSIAKGMTEVHGFLMGADCLSTMHCFQDMGISIEIRSVDGEPVIFIEGRSLHGLSRPRDILDVGNSGTTTRLMSGILAAQDFDVTLNGDASIQSRPMRRIMKPLSLMGADIQSVKGNDCAPLTIHGQKLHGIHYDSPVASAQVKSSILLAGLYAEEETSVTEPSLSRNHTEIMLRSFGIPVRSEGNTASIPSAAEMGERRLTGQKILVPGDISSAAYFIVAALIVPGSEVLIRNVGINPTRDGILRVLKAMGADITYLNASYESEPVADLFVRTSHLHGTCVEGEIIPALIDEIPVIAIAAAYAEGTTIIKDAAELKVKESDRIAVMVDNLSRMGAKITGTEDGMIIEGGAPLHGAEIDSHLDHRIAMSFAVAALAAEGTTTIKDAECVNISYPGFYDTLNSLVK